MSRDSRDVNLFRSSTDVPLASRQSADDTKSKTSLKQEITLIVVTVKKREKDQQELNGISH